MARTPARVLGYCVTEYAFFGQAFVAMLMVAADARGLDEGDRELFFLAPAADTPPP